MREKEIEEGINISLEEAGPPLPHHRKKPDLGLELCHSGVFGDLQVPQEAEGNLPVRVAGSTYRGQSQTSEGSLDCVYFLFLKHTSCFGITDSFSTAPFEKRDVSSMNRVPGDFGGEEAMPAASAGREHAMGTMSWFSHC